MATRLVVGLGNPGRNYEGTRHNAGFEVVDKLASRLGAGGFRPVLEGLAAEVREGENKVLLVKPQTFMNLSGQCVSKLVHFFKVPSDSLMVVCDDKDLPLGKLRIRAKGTHGGNNGLRSIQDHLGTEYPRLKVGTGDSRGGDAVSHVLGRFTAEEAFGIQEALNRAAMAVEVWLREGLESCMNKFNASPKKENDR